MNLKNMLTSSLMVVILLSTVSFGYLTYAIYSDSTSKTGSAMVSGHQILFYVMGALHLITFGLGGAVFYKG